MSFNSENVKTVTITIDSDPGGDARLFPALKAPRDITVVGAWMTSRAAQGAGTAVRLQLVNYGTAGTSASGTVVPYIGGTATASQLAANTPTAGTVDTSYDNITEGQWLYVVYNEQAVGWVSGDCFTYHFHYVNGA